MKVLQFERRFGKEYLHVEIFCIIGLSTAVKVKVKV